MKIGDNEERFGPIKQTIWYQLEVRIYIHVEVSLEGLTWGNFEVVGYKTTVVKFDRIRE